MEGSYAPHGTNASPLPPPRDLIKKVVQKCVCPFAVFFDIITEWLIKRKLIHQGKPSDILKQISEMEQSKYLQAQKETLAMLEWLKRYANAELLEE